MTVTMPHVRYITLFHSVSFTASHCVYILISSLCTGRELSIATSIDRLGKWFVLLPLGM